MFHKPLSEQNYFSQLWLCQQVCLPSIKQQKQHEKTFTQNIQIFIIASKSRSQRSLLSNHCTQFAIVQEDCFVSVFACTTIRIYLGILSGQRIAGRLPASTYKHFNEAMTSAEISGVLRIVRQDMSIAHTNVSFSTQVVAPAYTRFQVAKSCGSKQFMHTRRRILISCLCKSP